MSASLPVPSPTPAPIQREQSLISPRLQNALLFGIGIAAIVAVTAVAVMWGKTPEYKLLYANISDKDGGAILAQLSQMNIPYKNADGGGAILVPADKVHEARLKLASQGLPRGSTVGFELMENQRFGATQFQEQVNFQRALEGELAKSIQSIAAVQSARVHLALPKQSVFMREQQKASASVIVSIHPGRMLDNAQVAGIVHLVSSSVPDLPMRSVSVIDQQGTLLSNHNDGSTGRSVDPEKLNYQLQLEQAYNRRIMDLLEPIVGRNNARAQITADIDFSMIEQTAESFKPNVGEASVRSMAVNEANNNAGSGPQGVPGALSNQPPANATAPLQGGATNPSPAGAAPGVAGANNKREQTTNYEVDKTVRFEKRPVGNIKRLSAAVVVNNKRVVDANGAATSEAISEAELNKITALVKEAIGFTQSRGDSINVVNTPFTVEEIPAAAEVPLWKQPQNIELAKEVGKWLALMIVALIIMRGFIRPAMKYLTANHVHVPPAGEQDDENNPGAVYLPQPQQAAPEIALPPADNRLQDVRQLAKQEPGTVANVVRVWVGNNG